MVQTLRAYLSGAYRQAIVEAYTATQGSTGKAATLLGITPRYLQQITKEHGLVDWLKLHRVNVRHANNTSQVRTDGGGENIGES